MVVYNNPLVGQFNQKRPSRHRWDCGRDDGHTKTAKPKKIRYITQSSRPIKLKCLCPSAAGRTPSGRDPTPRRGWYFPRWFTRKVVVDVVVDYNNRHVNPQRPNKKTNRCRSMKQPGILKKCFPLCIPAETTWQTTDGPHVYLRTVVKCLDWNVCTLADAGQNVKKPFFVIK